MAHTYWEWSHLKDLSSISISNGVFNDPENVGSGYRLINVVDLYTEPSIDVSKLRRLHITKKDFKKFNVIKGDIFFTRSSLKLEGIAHCNIFDSDENDVIFECHIMRIRPKATRINPKFMRLYCISQPARKYFMKHSKTTTMTTINQDAVERLLVPVPPIEEQDNIVNIFAKWDRSIELTESLITAKQERRTWLMQQLLTGKRRLTGFDKPWKTVHLGDVFTNRVEINHPDLPLIAITGSGGVMSRGDLIRRDTSSEDKSKYLRICPGDIGYNTMRMWQGVCGLSQFEGIVSPAYTIVTPKDEVDGEFMALLFKSLPAIHLFHRHSQGLVDDTLNLKWRHFSEIKVTIPDNSEQKNIAAVFRIANRELNLLHSQLDALREQKKGLMQQLLTGKRRVKLENKSR